MNLSVTIIISIRNITVVNSSLLLSLASFIHSEDWRERGSRRNAERTRGEEKEAKERRRRRRRKRRGEGEKRGEERQAKE